MSRKIKMFIVVVALMICALMTSVMAADNVKNTRYDFITELFTKLGVVDKQYANVNTPDSLISADVFNAAVTAFYEDTSLAIKSGGRIVTVQEAVTAFAKGISGGSPIFDINDTREYKKYITPHQEEQLLEDVTFRENLKLTSEEFMQMLFNAMYIKPILPQASGEPLYFDSYAERNEIERVKGIVYANEITSLKSEYSAGPDSVVVGDRVYYDDNTGIGNYIGREAEVFVIDDLIIASRITESNTEVFVESKDFIDVNNRYITYYADGKTKKLRLASDFIQIYNWGLKLKKELETLQSSDLCRITLISNNKDKEYDVVIIEDLQVYQVGSIDKENLVIVDKNQLWRRDLSRIDYAISDGKRSMDFTDIKPNDVIYSMENDAGDYIKLYVSSDRIDGICTFVSQYDGICMVDGIEYGISACAAKDIDIGSDRRYYLGAFGRIEFSENISVNMYGLAYRIYYDYDVDAYMIKMVTQNGEDVSYKFTRKTKFYGEGLNGQKLSETMISTLEGYITRAMGQNTTSYGYGMAAPIVMYKEREGEIRSISMPVLFDEANSRNGRDSYTLESATALGDYLYTQAEHMYMNTTKGFYPSYRTPAYNDGAQKFVDDDTIVFSLTLGEDNIITRESIREAIITKSGNADLSATWIYANFYNMDKSNNADVMVKYHLGKESTNYASNLTVVKEAGWAVGKDDDIYYRIIGYNGGQEVEYYVKREAEIYTNFLNGFINSVPNITLEDIGKGDVLSLAMDSDGMVGYVSVMHLGDIEAEDYKRYHNTGNCESGREVMFGTVIGVSSDTMILQLDLNANSPKVTRFYVKNYKNANVYRYEDGNVYIGSASDVMLGDKVYVRLYHSIPKEIVVR